MINTAYFLALFLIFLRITSFFIITNVFFPKGTPMAFMDICAKYPPENRALMIEQCKSALCRALFNNSAAQGFWKLFEQTYELVLKYPNASVDHIYNRLDADVMDGCPDFDVLSLKFFVAKIKEGIE